MTPTTNTKAAVIEALEKAEAMYGQMQLMASLSETRELLAALRSEPEPTPEPGERDTKRAGQLLDAFKDAPFVQAQGCMSGCRPMTFGGCPFCGRQSCVAGECRASLPPAPEPVAGWQWVPTTPTLPMLDALRADTTPNLEKRYRAMLAAAPTKGTE
jgi:hypothetical protein